MSWLSEGGRTRSDPTLYALGSFVAEVRASFRPGPERDSVAVRLEETAGTARITVSAEARCAPVSPGAVPAQVEGKRAPR